MEKNASKSDWDSASFLFYDGRTKQSVEGNLRPEIQSFVLA